VCKRDGIINARKSDWMEWQAGYVCGALLMPISHFRRVVSGYQTAHKIFGPVALGGTPATALIDLVRREFRVSADAARVRLSQHSYVQAQDRGRSLFG
jgi:Zn-dependent peptidase ImmA (M78 family)